MSLLDRVTAIINKRGTAIGYTPLVAPVYDPATGRATPGATVTRIRRAVVEPLGQGVAMTYTGRQSSDGGALLAKNSLVRLTMDSAVTPQLGDTFVLSGASYAVTWMKPTYAGDDIVLWTVDGEAK